MNLSPQDEDIIPDPKRWTNPDQFVSKKARQFDAAMAAKDAAGVSRFAKLFHPLGVTAQWSAGAISKAMALEIN